MKSIKNIIVNAIADTAIATRNMGDRVTKWVSPTPEILEARKKHAEELRLISEEIRTTHKLYGVAKATMQVEHRAQCQELSARQKGERIQLKEAYVVDVSKLTAEKKTAVLAGKKEIAQLQLESVKNPTPVPTSTPAAEEETGVKEANAFLVAKEKTMEFLREKLGKDATQKVESVMSTIPASWGEVIA